MADEDFYTVLGITRAASTDDVRRAYKREALKWHPDKHSIATRTEAEAKFKRVAEAFEVLSDPQKRAAYDNGGAATGNPFSRANAGRRSSTPTASSSNARRAFHTTHESPFERFDPFFGMPRSDPFASFMFRDPFELFNQMFADMHEMMHGGRARHQHQNQRAQHQHDPFASFFSHDPFFGPMGFGMMMPPPPSMMMMSMPPMMMGMGGFPNLQPQQHQHQQHFGGGVGGSSMSFTSFSSSLGGGGQSQSYSVQVTEQNGRRVTKTSERTVLPDGTVRENSDEKVQERRAAQNLQQQPRLQQMQQQQQQFPVRQVPRSQTQTQPLLSRQR
jgi:hypothetical protein